MAAPRGRGLKGVVLWVKDPDRLPLAGAANTTGGICPTRTGMSSLQPAPWRRTRGAMTRQILTIKWGRKYGPEYLDRLYGMVARHLAAPFSFFCLTDDPTGIRPEVTCLPLPDLGCAMPTGTKGIWGKSRLWAPDLGGPTGPVLFLDLDLS